MRELTEHVVDPANGRLVITVVDERGHGGANHRYEITGFDVNGNQSAGDDTDSRMVVLFQNGPISVDGNGVNGITQEALLAIVADRLRSFQAGPYSCKANAYALINIEEALRWLQQRTLERMRRGVEGTHEK